MDTFANMYVYSERNGTKTAECWRVHEFKVIFVASTSFSDSSNAFSHRIEIRQSDWKKATRLKLFSA